MKNPTRTTRASLTHTAVHNARWFAGLLAGTAALHAADIQWTGTTGSYFTAGDWSTGTVPGPNDFAWVGNGGTVQITSSDPQLTTQDFRTGAGGLAGTMEQSGGIANITSWFRMGVEVSSTGGYTMTGGLLNVRNNRFNVGEKGAGSFTLSGGTVYHGNGTLIVGDRNIGGGQSSPTSTGVINQSGGTFTNDSEVWIGLGADGDNTDFGTLNLTGGTFNVRRWFVVGRTGGEGVVNISGADTLFAKSLEDGSHFVVASPDGSTNSKGVINQNGGTVMLGSECWTGQGGTSNGTYNLNSGTILTNNWFSAGRAGGTGVFNMAGGNIVKTGGGGISIGGGGGASTGTFNHTAGLFLVSEGEVYVGENGTGLGTYNLSGTGDLRCGNLIVSRSETVDGVLNLDGGTVRPTRIFRNATDAGALGTVNFNGSQIIGTSNQTAFIASLTTADVKSGGMKIDTDTYDLGTTQAFTGTGGLVKTGLGKLTIGNGFAANGPSTVSRGILAVNTGSFAGNLTLSDGASLSGSSSTIAGTTEVAASGGALLADSASATPLAFGGNVTLNGPTRIDFSNATVAPGTYKVATYAGTLTDNGNLFLGRPGSVSLATPNEINVTVEATRTLTWTGTASSTWDIFSALNWDNAGTPAAFGQGDSVTLGDPAGSAPISVTGPLRPAALTINNSSGNTVTLQAGNSAAEITGTVALSKQGAGKAILDIDATLGTGSTVNIAAGGELQVGNGGTSGSLGLAAITNAGTLHFNLNRDRIVTNAITGSGSASFIKSGTGHLTLTGAFGNPGTTTINDGRLTLVTPAILTGTGTTINSGAELEIRSTSNHDGYTGTLSGSGKLIKTGGSELFLNANNSGFTGDIEVRRGPTNSLNIRNVNGLGSPTGKTVVHGMNGTNSQQLNIRNLGTGSPFTIAEPIELRANAFGRAGITHEAGSGNSQAINLTGPIGVYSTGRSAVNLLRNFNRTATVTFSGEITGQMGGSIMFLRGNNDAVTGSINVLGGINIQDDAELVITEEVRVRLGGAGKSYSNFRTTIANGHLRTLVDNALPPQHRLFLGEGNNAVDSKLFLGEGATAVQQTVGDIGSNNTDPDCRIVGGASSNSTFTMDLSGNATFPSPFGGAGANENNLNIVKKGVGTLTLSATSSTYTGTTTVSGGTLLVNGFILSSAFGVQAGGTIGGSGTIGPVTVAGTAGSNARIAPGNNAVGTLSVTGAASLGPDSAIDLQITDWTAAAGSGFDSLSVSGALSLTATPSNPLVIRIDDINLPLEFFTETTASFDIVTAAGGITGFDASAISIDGSQFTSGVGDWSISQVGNSLRLTYSGTPYGNWIAAKGLAGTPAGKDADPDGDGISNAIEFVLGTEPNPANPDSMSVTDLPVATLDSTHLTLVFRRTDLSASAQPEIEYGNDLIGWATAIDGVDGVTISVVENGIAAGIDQVTVKIPRGTNTSLFARLRATVLP